MNLGTRSGRRCQEQGCPGKAKAILSSLKSSSHHFNWKKMCPFFFEDSKPSSPQWQLTVVNSADNWTSLPQSFLFSIFTLPRGSPCSQGFKCHLDIENVKFISSSQSSFFCVCVLQIRMSTWLLTQLLWTSELWIAPKTHLIWKRLLTLL